MRAHTAAPPVISRSTNPRQSSADPPTPGISRSTNPRQSSADPPTPDSHQLIHQPQTVISRATNPRQSSADPPTPDSYQQIHQPQSSADPPTPVISRSTNPRQSSADPPTPDSTELKILAYFSVTFFTFLRSSMVRMLELISMSRRILVPAQAWIASINHRAIERVC